MVKSIRTEFVTVIRTKNEGGAAAGSAARCLSCACESLDMVISFRTEPGAVLAEV